MPQFSSSDSSDIDDDPNAEPLTDSDNDDYPTRLSPSRPHQRSHDSSASSRRHRTSRSRDSSGTRSASPGPSEYVSGRITPASGVSSLDWDMYTTANADGEPDVRYVVKGTTVYCHLVYNQLVYYPFCLIAQPRFSGLGLRLGSRIRVRVGVGIRIIRVLV